MDVRRRQPGKIRLRDARSKQAVILLTCGLLVGSSLFGQADTPGDALTQQSLKFAEIYGKVEQNYLAPVDPDQTILNGAVRGLLSSLDPFSAFFDQEQFEMLQQQARGQTKGFGSILYVQTGKVVILQTAQGSPSERAGLGPGDEIVEVNGTRIDRLDFPSLIQVLERARSQRVHLGVIHPGQLVSQDFVLNPAEVALPTVDKAFAYAPGIAHIHLTGFEEKTPQEVADAVTRLGGPGLQGLLLDLRDNHGGMVESALGVVSLFLKPGALVLTVRGRREAEKSYHTIAGPNRFDFPLIVLVNANTASAAEVVTAALQEHDRALIAGEPTFGKGVVESVMGLSEKTGLALTTAQYFTPSGRSIQRPLPGTALAGVELASSRAVGEQPLFHTDDGRPITAAGGVTPDVAIPAPEVDPWATFLNQRGIFTSFASSYLTLHSRVGRSFEPDAQVLTSFQEYLARQQIRAPEEYWKGDQDYLKLRIKTEVVTLAEGLEAGDEIETRADPQVEKAVTLFSRITRLLGAPVGAHTHRAAKE
ncbi:MAG TPA: S41 family peptidase [Terriglobia bacterium]|nr:S41 family peptidase [Terriglobia bacterium]